MIQFVGLRNLLRRYVVKWFDCIIRTIFFGIQLVYLRN